MSKLTESPIDLSILVVSFNTREFTCECLRSVYEQTTATTFEVLVVDNASADGSADAIAAEFPQVQLIRSDENLGFAVANNLAATHASGRYILLLNSDTVILDGAIDRLVEFAEQTGEPGVFGGRTVFADGTSNASSCWGEPTLWSELCMALGLTKRFRGSRLFDSRGRDDARLGDVDVITGCFALLKRDLWERLDGFDTRFFMYAEDFDLSLRARALGAPARCCPEATIIHHCGASDTVRADKMIKLFRAQAQLYTKHWSPFRAMLGKRILDLWACSRVVALSILRFAGGNFRESYAVWSKIWGARRSWRHNLFGDPPPLPKLAPHCQTSTK
ncbi:MAG: glycosyltransferase family 2 protein [Planctomycetota bacterium]